MIESGQGGHVDMICTQPRRISAMAVADRVAAERAEPIGRTVECIQYLKKVSYFFYDTVLTSPGNVQVGYQIRLEAKRSDATRLLFCTTGVLLRRLQVLDTSSMLT